MYNNMIVKDYIVMSPPSPLSPRKTTRAKAKRAVGWGGGVVLCALKTGPTLLTCRLLGRIRAGKGGCLGDVDGSLLSVDVRVIRTACFSECEWGGDMQQLLRA